MFKSVRRATCLLTAMVGIAAFADVASAQASTCTVGGTCTVGSESDLVSAIEAVDTAHGTSATTIDFSSNITLSSDLPIIYGPVVINGQGNTLNGAGAYRGFLFYYDTGAPVNATVENLTFQDTVAKGGNGAQGAGGGAGLGGALFVGDNVNLTIGGLTFTGDGAVGGTGGGSFGSNSYGGGGGGMGGNGGQSGGGGGLGLGANGGDNLPQSGLPGIAFGLASGGGDPAAAQYTGGSAGGGGAATGGAGGGGGIGGVEPSSLSQPGGNGGFGGGGGAGYQNSGGVGGFGGGGGASLDSNAGSANGGDGSYGGGGGYGASDGGNGGFAGGGGAADSAFVGEGGSSATSPSKTSDGSEQATAAGGGGGALGGAIFVQAGGGLTANGVVTESGDTVTAGQGGLGGGHGAAMGSALFLQGGTGTLSLAPGAGQTESFAGSILDASGAGDISVDEGGWALTKSGSGVLVLGGTDDWEGGTTVSAGTLQVTGTMHNGATITGGDVQISGTVVGPVNANTVPLTVDSGAVLTLDGGTVSGGPTGVPIVVNSGGILCESNGKASGTAGDGVTNNGGSVNPPTCHNAPTATISSPSSGQTYNLDQSVSVGFSCGTGGGLPIASCAGSDGAGGISGSFTGALNTSAVGNYTYTVTALSDNGLVTTAQISYSVVANCVHKVDLPLTEFLTSSSVCMYEQQDGSYQTTGPLTINGVPLPAVSASDQYLISPVSSANPGGLFGLQNANAGVDVSFKLGSLISLDAGQISWKLPTSSTGGPVQVAALTLPSGQTLAGLGIGGTSIAMDFGKSSTGDYYATFPITVDLPSIFKNGPGKDAGGISGTAAVKVDANGVDFDGLNIQVTNAYIGALQVKSACFSYNPGDASGVVSGCPEPALAGSPLPALSCTSVGGASWSGSADVVLPVESGPELSFYGDIGEYDNVPLVTGLSVSASGLQVPLAEDVFLTNVGIQFCSPTAVQPLAIAGDVGVGAVSTGDGTYLADINAAFSYTAAFGNTPWSLTLGGSIGIEGTQVGSATLTFGGSDVVAFDIKAGVSLDVVSINGEVKGFFETASPYQFSVEGDINGCISSYCLGLEAAVSSVGLSGCITVSGDWQAGFGYYWGGAFSLWGFSCDIGNYEIATPSAADQFVVAHGLPGVGVKITGRGGAPNVKLTGPHGQLIQPLAAGSTTIRTKTAWVVQDPKDDTTYVLLIKPRAGRWAVSAASGSVPVGAISTAAGLQAPVVRGAVRRVSAHKIDVGVDYSLAAGEKLTVLATGPHATDQILHATRIACPAGTRFPAGSHSPACADYAFDPVFAPNGKRHVYAVVSRNGLAIHRFALGSIRVAYAKPHAPKPSILRRGTTLQIGWVPSQDVKNYAVGITTSTGQSLSYTVRSNVLKLPGIAKSTSVSVKVWPVLEDGVVAPVGSVRLAANRTSTKPTKKKK